MHPWHDKFATLAAAFCLRDEDFAGRYGEIVRDSRHDLFVSYAMADVVDFAMSRYEEAGQLAPAAVLLGEIHRIGRPEVGRSTYKEVIERIFDTELEGRAHVEKVLATEAAKRAISSLPVGELAGSPERFFALVGEIQERMETGSDRVKVRPRLLRDLAATHGDEAPEGIALGFPSLDDNLCGGGVCAGEVLVWLARYNLGKTAVLVQAARNVARRGLPVMFVTYETSEWLTTERFLLGLADDDLDLPLSITYSPGPEYGARQIEADARRMAHTWGRLPALIVRDYGEIASTTPDDYHAVRQSYLSFKRMCGRLGVPGLDAAQKNRNDAISYHDILKDVDIVVDLMGAGGDDRVMIARVERNRSAAKGPDFRLLKNMERGEVVELG